MIVAICVFSLFHPTQLEIRPANGSVVVVGDRTLEANQQLSLHAPSTAQGRNGAETRFILSIPGKIRREFQGRLEIRREGEHLQAIVTMENEVAVASIVAAESPPGAPLEARKAQAVVARSFLTKSRHQGFDFCDTTHCQFMREPQTGNINQQAADQTRGLVLIYQGRAIPALYSANCGGQTQTLEQAGWNPGPYPYFTVKCPVTGPVKGHRLGMCQEGAASLARNGHTFREILNSYFPATSIGPSTEPRQ